MIVQGASYPTYLINLKSRSDRLKHAISEASKIAKAVLLIQAIDGSLVTERDGGLLTNSQQACFDSHKLAFQEFLLTSYSYALILEDDILILDRDKIRSALSSKEILNFDLIQFGYLKMGIRHRLDLVLTHIENWFFAFCSKVLNLLPINSKRYVSRLRFRRQIGNLPGFIQGDIRSGAHCYLISRKLAQFILEINPPYYLPIDSLFGVLQYTDKFKVSRSIRSLAGQSGSPSSIKGHQ